MSSTAKRVLDAPPLPSKRSRMVVMPRLCDLANGADVFFNEHNRIKAREKGILRSRDASAKYEEVCLRELARVPAQHLSLSLTHTHTYTHTHTRARALVVILILRCAYAC